MTTPHVHQATINAWAAGAQIQWRRNDLCAWLDDPNPHWHSNVEYRVKHKHQVLIDAHAAGELIEVEDGSGDYWIVDLAPEWREDRDYRISPRSAELKPIIAAHNAGKKIESNSGGPWLDTFPTWSSLFDYRIKDKFADLRKAFAEGALIECYNSFLDQFCVVLRPVWAEDSEYRICQRSYLKPVIEAHLKGKQIEYHQIGSRHGWSECVTTPKWQSSHNYRVKTRWQKELDAWRAGKKIEARRTDVSHDTWDVQLGCPIEQAMIDDVMKLEFRVFDEYRDLKEAEARGEVIELRPIRGGLWFAQAQDCLFNYPFEDYRVSPRSAELRPIIDAWKAGKTIQAPSRTNPSGWRDIRSPMFDSRSNYRIKPEAVWPKELDAYLKGELIQNKGGGGGWHDQNRSPALEQELRDGKIGLELRIKHKHQACIDAWNRGEDVQVNSADGSGEWLTMDRDPPEPAWLEDLSYRIKPAHKHQACIDAFNAGQTVQCLRDETHRWYDHKPGSASPHFSEKWEYRIKLPHQEVRDAFAEGKKVQYRSHTSNLWCESKAPGWFEDYEYRAKPEPLMSRRYVFERYGEKQVGLCTPCSFTSVPANSFVRWIDDDWVETEA